MIGYKTGSSPSDILHYSQDFFGEKLQGWKNDMVANMATLFATDIL